MKLLIMLFFIVMSRGLAQNSTFCTNRADGLYSDPSSCKSFIHCHQSGQTTIKLCPKGTRFDSTIKVCNWARSVKCNNRPKHQTVPPAPIDLSARAMGATAISLRWKDPKLNNDSILKYIVTYGIAGKPIEQLSQHFRGYANTAVITNLIPGMQYEVKVQAITFGGFGAPSIVRVRTTTGDLCPPGHYSKTGKKPCQRCVYGSYQSGLGKQTCIKCPHGTITLHKGSNSKYQCQNVNVD